MSYERILPRDLFNDASLLKCMGQITLLIHDGKLDLKVNHRHSDKDFRITQDASDGATRVSNLTFDLRNGWTVQFRRPYNSRNLWPLHAYVADGVEEIKVFDDHGHLTPEFVTAIEHGHTLPAPI